MPALVPLLLEADGWPLFAPILVAVFLANHALKASGLRGADTLRFYASKPAWTLVVQILLFALLPLLALSIPRGRANGNVCGTTVNGERVELTPAECETLRIRTLRTAAGSWMAVGWLAVAQFALIRTRTRERGRYDDQSRENLSK